MSLSTITMSGHRCLITQLVGIFTSQSNLTFSLSNTGSALLLPKRDYVMLGSLLSQIRLSSVMFVRPTQGVETFGNISSPFCTLAILWRWPQHKILPRLSQGNPSVGGVICKRGNKIRQCHIWVYHLLMSFFLFYYYYQWKYIDLNDSLWKWCTSTLCNQHMIILR